MEVLSMFQRRRSVALEYEKLGTYGTGLVHPLDRLVECGFTGYVTTIHTWDYWCSWGHTIPRSKTKHPFYQSSLNLSFALYSHTHNPRFLNNQSQPMRLLVGRTSRVPYSVFLTWLQALVTLLLIRTFLAHIHNLFGFPYNDSYLFSRERELRINLVYDA
ncbi:hypothetical protein PIB30_077838 [Stylosanthes scabra]|uniref:Uncharacterized protein n=1 Tax=Stylosanthes scabra TaxID=79078 RepID=A0ABU6SRB8_9FABA|nr:hypothetical protein [Stylosanthes scabra]